MFSSKPKFDVDQLKGQLKLATHRIKLVRQQKIQENKISKKRIADLLKINEETKARFSVETVILQEWFIEGLDMVEMFIEFMIPRVGLLIDAKDFPLELKEAAASLIFVTNRIQGSIPELKEIRKILATKWKDFCESASVNKDLNVNNNMIVKFCQKAETPLCIQYLKEIAAENNVEWLPKGSSMGMGAQSAFLPPTSALQNPNMDQDPSSKLFKLQQELERLTRQSQANQAPMILHNQPEENYMQQQQIPQFQTQNLSQNISPQQFQQRVSPTQSQNFTNPQASLPIPPTQQAQFSTFSQPQYQMPLQQQFQPQKFGNQTFNVGPSKNLDFNHIANQYDPQSLQPQMYPNPYSIEEAARKNFSPEQPKMQPAFNQFQNQQLLMQQKQQQDMYEQQQQQHPQDELQYQQPADIGNGEVPEENQEYENDNFAELQKRFEALRGSKIDK